MQDHIGASSPLLVGPRLRILACQCSDPGGTPSSKPPGYSQVRENGSGKIKTFRAVKNGKEMSVDSRGRIKSCNSGSDPDAALANVIRSRWRPYAIFVGTRDR
jgi:hypothetical protein